MRAPIRLSSAICIKRSGKTVSRTTLTPLVSDISALTLTGVERLTGNSGELRLTGSQLQSLSSITGVTSLAITGGGAVDLAKLQALGMSNWRIADGSAYTITGTAAGDSITLGAGTTQVSVTLNVAWSIEG